MYTKNGKPLQVQSAIVYSNSGRVVGRIHGDKVFGTNGRYVGTIVGDRLVFRRTDSSELKSSFSASNRAHAGKGLTSATGIQGEEPDIPE